MLAGLRVNCPCCSQPLYQVTSIARGLSALSRDSPSIEFDSDGYFMTCRHCRKRIVFERNDRAPSGIGFELSGNQPCSAA
jgi:hypothetical protein